MSVQIASAPDGTQACPFDIKLFHRTCPVTPDHKPYIVVEFEGKFYIDHVHPFGLATASSNAGQIANAATQIWVLEWNGHGWVLKYEDDMSNLCFPLQIPLSAADNSLYQYKYDRDQSMALIEDLGVPWHLIKTGKEFLDDMIFIGFYWDIKLRRVSLPEPKRLKFLARVEALLNWHGRVSLLQMQEIHGSLVHVVFVYRDGSSRLPQFSNFVGQFKNEFSLRYMPGNVRKALEWWQERLSDPTAYRQLSPLPEMQDLGIYVDASTLWGIGIIFGGLWYAFRLAEGWKEPGRDICWLEAVALELMMHFLVQFGFRDCHLLMHSDNDGAIGAHSKGRSPNSEINLCVRRTYKMALEFDIVPTFRYIESALNPADPISRGEFPARTARLQRSFTLPRDLADLLIDA